MEHKHIMCDKQRRLLLERDKRVWVASEKFTFADVLRQFLNYQNYIQPFTQRNGKVNRKINQVWS